jgi:hypothetical protein
MSDKKKTRRVKRKNPIDIKAYKDADLVPAEFYDKKTGEYQDLKTFFASQLSRKSALDSKKTQKSRDRMIKLLKKWGIDTSDEEYVDRVEKAETKAKRKKVTGPELTTPKSKKSKAAKGKLIGPSYRHGRKDYRKGGLFK